MKHTPARGLSLVEMMVALVAGLIVSAAVIAFMLSSMRSNGEYVQSTRLTQELRNTLDLVTRDLSRAGYNDDALNYVAATNASPFSPVFIKDEGTPIDPGDASTYGDADEDGCIVYAYDRTFPIGFATSCSAAGCGTLGQLDYSNAELRGIRRVCIDGACDGEADDVGVIEYAESSGAAPFTCADPVAGYGTNPPTCNGSWCSLSDPTLLNITRFMAIDASANVSTMRIRDISLHLEGQLVHTPDFTRAVTTKVKIRADCIASNVATCEAAPVPPAP